MKKLVKSIVGITLAAAIVGGGVWAAIATDIGANHSVRFEVVENVIIDAAAYLGTKDDEMNEGNTIDTFIYNSTVDGVGAVEWIIAEDEETGSTTTLNRANRTITYTFNFANTGETAIRIIFAVTIDNDTQYSIIGGLVDETGAYVMNETNYTLTADIEYEGEPVDFVFELHLDSIATDSDCNVVFDVDVISIEDPVAGA